MWQRQNMDMDKCSHRQIWTQVNVDSGTCGHANIPMRTHGYVKVETYIWRHESRHPVTEKQTQHPGTHRHTHSVPQAQARRPSPIPLARLARPTFRHSAPPAPAPGSLQSSLLAHQRSMPPMNTGMHTQRPCIQTHDTSFTFGIMVGWRQHPPILEAKGPPVPGAEPPLGPGPGP